MSSYRLLQMDVPGLADQQGRQLCVDTGCSLEDLLGTMDDRDE